MFLLVGLGNPDKEYQATRHNVGFMVADEIYRHFSFDAFRNKFQGLIASGKIANEAILLLKPQTYMNASGLSVAQVVKFYKIPVENVIVFHDDMDLKVGTIKAKIGGGNAGHNGLKSIDSAIGSNYGRIRVGVGRPDDKAQVIDWVLSRFSKNDAEMIDKVLDIITQNIELYITKGCSSFSSFIGEKTNGI